MSQPACSPYTPRPIERFHPRSLGPRSWGEELLIAETPHYLGKVLTMKAGRSGNLQMHRTKDETFYLLSGRACVDHDPGRHVIHRVDMRAGESYRIPPGAVHKVTAVTDCVFLEVSTPVFDDRVRLEREYGLPESYGLPTTPCESSG